MNKIKKWYRSKLQDFIDFVAEPSGVIVRDYILLVMAILYIVLGVFIIMFPNNILLLKMGYGDVRLNLILIILFGVGGLFMLISWLFLENKILWKRKGKVVTAEKCWIIPKILFVVLIPLIYTKKVISYILRETRQEKVVVFIPEILLSLVLSFCVFLLLEVRLISGIFELSKLFFRITFSDEFIVLCMVVMFIFTFFISSKIIIHISLRVFVWELKRNELKRTSKVNVIGTMKTKPIKEEIEKKYKEMREKADVELKYSKLYFYVIMNIILLSIHFEADDIYGNLFKNGFIGVTSLAALLREVGANRNEERE